MKYMISHSTLSIHRVPAEMLIRRVIKPTQFRAKDKRGHAGRSSPTQNSEPHMRCVPVGDRVYPTLPVQADSPRGVAHAEHARCAGALILRTPISKNPDIRIGKGRSK